MPSCFSAFLSIQAFAEEFQQLSGDKGPNNLVPLFLLFHVINASLSQSFSSWPKIPSSPAWGFNPATFKQGLSVYELQKSLKRSNLEWINSVVNFLGTSLSAMWVVASRVLNLQLQVGGLILY